MEAAIQCLLSDDGSQQSGDDSAVSEVELSPPVKTTMSTSRIVGSILRSNREYILIAYYCKHFVPANVLPQAQADFSGDPFYLKLAHSTPEVMNAICACSAIHQSNIQPGYRVVALHYYTRAVSGLRKKLGSRTLSGAEDWLLAMTLLLHVFEVR